MAVLTAEEQLNANISSLEAVLLANDGSPGALNPVPARVVDLYPGTTVAWDSCCAGQLSFQLVSMSPKYNSASRISLRQPCAIDWWDTVLRVQILRCTPTVDSAGHPPAPDKISASGDQVLSDMQALLGAITGQSWVYQIGSWNPVGPEGGCIGGSWTFTTRLDSVPCN